MSQSSTEINNAAASKRLKNIHHRDIERFAQKEKPKNSKRGKLTSSP